MKTKRLCIHCSKPLDHVGFSQRKQMDFWGCYSCDSAYGFAANGYVKAFPLKPTEDLIVQESLAPRIVEAAKKARRIIRNRENR